MRRFWLRSLLLGLVPLQALPAAAAAAPPAAAEFGAEAIEVDLDHDRSVAQGAASFTYRGLTLHADSLTADRATGELEASGKIQVVERLGHRFWTSPSSRYPEN